MERLGSEALLCTARGSLDTGLQVGRLSLHCCSKRSVTCPTALGAGVYLHQLRFSVHRLSTRF